MSSGSQLSLCLMLRSASAPGDRELGDVAPGRSVTVCAECALAAWMARRSSLAGRVQLFDSSPLSGSHRDQTPQGQRCIQPLSLLFSRSSPLAHSPHVDHQCRFRASLRLVSRSSRRWRAQRNNGKEPYLCAVQIEGVQRRRVFEGSCRQICAQSRRNCRRRERGTVARD